MYVASTFFFQKLTSGGVESGEEGWQNVRRWTRTLPGGLLSQKFVLVPINEDNIHWWLAVVCHPLKALEPEAGDEVKTTEAWKQPRLVCLDSAQEPPPKGRTTFFLRGYLWREWLERHQGASGADASRDAMRDKVGKLLKGVEADVPKQANSFDCGIFIIEYLLHLLQSKSALCALGLASHTHWFGQESVSHRRKQLRMVAQRLIAEGIRQSESDVGRLLQDEELRSSIVKTLTERAPKRAQEDEGSTRLAKFQRATRSRTAAKADA